MQTNDSPPILNLGFGAALHAARNKRNFGIRWVSNRTGIGRQRLQEMEDGVLAPTAVEHKRLTSVFRQLEHFGPELAAARERGAAQGQAAAVARDRAAAKAPLTAKLPLPAEVRVVPPPPPEVVVRRRTALAVQAVPEPVPSAPPPAPQASDLAVRLRAYREREKLSQYDLADMLQVGQTAVSQWERGVSEPRAEKRPQVDGLLDGSWKPSPKAPPAPEPAALPRTAQRTVYLWRLPVGVERKAFGPALAEAREKHGLSRVELSELLGVGRSTTLSWESGEHVPLQEKYNAIVELLPEMRFAGAPGPLDQIFLVDPPAPGQKPEAPPRAAAPAPAAPVPVLAAPVPVVPVPVTIKEEKPVSTPVAPSSAPSSSSASFLTAARFLRTIDKINASAAKPLVLELLEVMQKEGLSAGDALALFEGA